MKQKSQKYDESKVSLTFYLNRDLKNCLAEIAHSANVNLPDFLEAICIDYLDNYFNTNTEKDNLAKVH